MFKLLEAQVGDLLFYKANNLLGYIIGFFSDPFHPFDKKVSHVSVISKIDEDGTVHIIEAHINGGVVEKELNPKWYDNIIHMRLKRGLHEAEKAKLIKYFRDNHVGKNYDEWSFPSKFIRTFILSRETPILNDPDAFDCAENVAVAFKEALMIELRPNINIHTVNPQQLRLSKKLKLVA